MSVRIFAHKTYDPMHIAVHFIREISGNEYQAARFDNGGLRWDTYEVGVESLPAWRLDPADAVALHRALGEVLGIPERAPEPSDNLLYEGLLRESLDREASRVDRLLTYVLDE